jgi:uncharacterized protein
MVFLGLAVTLIAGVALGLLGGGGSLLVVPALVYLFGHPPVEATAYSLAIVGAASVTGTYLHWVRRPIPLRSIASFGVPSVAAAYLVRAVLVPRLPAILSLGPIHVSLDMALMLAFAAFAAAAGIAMLRRRCLTSGTGLAPAWVPVVGVATGALTALLGAGGGFLVLPALVLLVGLPVDDAIGASLAVVAGQSVSGALGALSVMPAFDARMAFVLVSTMLLGVAWGVAAADCVPPARLKRGFGWLLLMVAAGMTLGELW